ncbi:hypothetical protein JD969_14245 [Planctomycetota bacterium]|nr:hypothetical protein JD969_14245 [Planctomycetota bacterium]
MTPLIAFIIDIAFKSLIITAIASTLIPLLMRKSPAAARHFAWFLTTIALLILPFASSFLPSLPLLPTNTIIPTHITTQPPTTTTSPPLSVTTTNTSSSFELPTPTSNPILSPSSNTPTPQPEQTLNQTPLFSPSTTKPSFDYTYLIFAPPILLITFIPLAFLRLRHIKKHANLTTDENLLNLLDQQCSSLSITPEINLYQSAKATMPMTFGYLPSRSANILLPSSANQWPTSRTRSVLLHELAHIKRYDCLTQLLAYFACCLYYFNPLVWFAAHRMNIERERACDDLVLTQTSNPTETIKPSDYAQLILDIATNSTTPSALSILTSGGGGGGIQMANKNTFEKRILAILDTNRIRTTLTKPKTLLITLLLLSLTIPTAMLTAAPARKNSNRKLAQSSSQNDSTSLRTEVPVPTPANVTDVADISATRITLDKDKKKTYILMDSQSTSEETESQPRPLLIIIPGGDGSEDFHFFCRRLYKFAALEANPNFIAVQPIAPQWSKMQTDNVTWPNKYHKFRGMKFTTETLINDIIKDVKSNHKIDETKIFTLAWSSGGPAAYDLALQKDSPVTGSFVAMSVFKPRPQQLRFAKNKNFFIYHSKSDRVVPYNFSSKALSTLTKAKANVMHKTYDGNHGWFHANNYDNISDGLEHLQQQNKSNNPSLKSAEYVISSSYADSSENTSDMDMRGMGTGRNSDTRMGQEKSGSRTSQRRNRISDSLVGQWYAQLDTYTIKQLQKQHSYLRGRENIAASFMIFANGQSQAFLYDIDASEIISIFNTHSNLTSDKNNNVVQAYYDRDKPSTIPYSLFANNKTIKLRDIVDYQPFTRTKPQSKHSNADYQFLGNWYSPIYAIEEFNHIFTDDDLEILENKGCTTFTFHVQLTVDNQIFVFAYDQRDATDCLLKWRGTWNYKNNKLQTTLNKKSKISSLSTDKQTLSFNHTNLKFLSRTKAHTQNLKNEILGDWYSLAIPRSHIKHFLSKEQYSAIKHCDTLAYHYKFQKNTGIYGTLYDYKAQTDLIKFKMAAWDADDYNTIATTFSGRRNPIQLSNDKQHARINLNGSLDIYRKQPTQNINLGLIQGKWYTTLSEPNIKNIIKAYLSELPNPPSVEKAILHLYFNQNRVLGKVHLDDDQLVLVFIDGFWEYNASKDQIIISNALADSPICSDPRIILNNNNLLQFNDTVQLPILNRGFPSGPYEYNTNATTITTDHINQKKYTSSSEETDKAYIYIMGDIVRPGAYVAADDLLLRELIASAGGIPTLKSSKDQTLEELYKEYVAYLTRNDGQGNIKTITNYNFYDLLVKRIGIKLQPNDLVNIGSADKNPPIYGNWYSQITDRITFSNIHLYGVDSISNYSKPKHVIAQVTINENNTIAGNLIVNNNQYTIPFIDGTWKYASDGSIVIKNKFGKNLICKNPQITSFTRESIKFDDTTNLPALTRNKPDSKTTAKKDQSPILGHWHSQIYTQKQFSKLNNFTFDNELLSVPDPFMLRFTFDNDKNANLHFHDPQGKHKDVLYQYGTWETVSPNVYKITTPDNVEGIIRIINGTLFLDNSAEFQFNREKPQLTSIQPYLGDWYALQLPEQLSTNLKIKNSFLLNKDFFGLHCKLNPDNTGALYYCNSFEKQDIWLASQFTWQDDDGSYITITDTSGDEIGSIQKPYNSLILYTHGVQLYRFEHPSNDIIRQAHKSEDMIGHWYALELPLQYKNTIFSLAPELSNINKLGLHTIINKDRTAKCYFYNAETKQDIQLFDSYTWDRYNLNTFKITSAQGSQYVSYNPGVLFMSEHGLTFKRLEDQPPTLPTLQSSNYDNSHFIGNWYTEAQREPQQTPPNAGYLNVQINPDNTWLIQAIFTNPTPSDIVSTETVWSGTWTAGSKDLLILHDSKSKDAKPIVFQYANAITNKVSLKLNDITLYKDKPTTYTASSTSTPKQLSQDQLNKNYETIYNTLNAIAQLTDSVDQADTCNQITIQTYQKHIDMITQLSQNTPAQTLIESYTTNITPILTSLHEQLKDDTIEQGNPTPELNLLLSLTSSTSNEKLIQNLRVLANQSKFPSTFTPTPNAKPDLKLAYSQINAINGAARALSNQFYDYDSKIIDYTTVLPHLERFQKQFNQWLNNIPYSNDPTQGISLTYAQEPYLSLIQCHQHLSKDERYSASSLYHQTFLVTLESLCDKVSDMHNSQ